VSAIEPVESIAYHLTPEAWFRARPQGEPYLPEAYPQDGFVHLTHGLEQVIEVGNRFYRDQPGPWLLLTVDLTRATADVRYDDPRRQFPHLYGPLDRCAIVAVHDMLRGADGGFIGVGPEHSRR
jgi:uncharacterized protein (DUF952 family)